MNAFRKTTLLLSAFTLLLAACSTNEDHSSRIPSVRWELVTNFTDTPEVFEARFLLVNHGDFALNDKNWTLFFNMAPRPIVANKSPQPAVVKHINGDWYKLVPEQGFTLAPGDSVIIKYWGTEGVIKETDRPLGLYFVFYEDGKERIAEVTDFAYAPFARPEQINRNASDEEPIPTPDWMYAQNTKLSRLATNQLMPIIPSPVRYTVQAGSLQLSNEFTIVYDKGLDSEAQYLAEKLAEITGTTFKTSAQADSNTKVIRLALGKVDLPASSEAYSLAVSADKIAITGVDAAGVFYGVQTLRGLIPLDAYKEKRASIALPLANVTDAPRFGFRGLHMDVSRNFQTKETVLRVLDLLSFYKINRFLLYTSEDEGWRLEIDGLPELTSVGSRRQHTSGKEAPALHPAYGSGPFADAPGKHGSGYYTKEDFIEILKYAKARHIKVIPELNFPGHARAAIKSMEARYERLMKEGKEEEANEYRLIDPDDKSEYLSAQSFTDNVVCVARESTFRFYEKVVDEIAKMYKEAGLVLDEFHTGGDEVAEGAWTKSPMALELMKEHPDIKDPKNLQTYFFRELVKRLKKRNLTTVYGWEEVALLKNEQGTYDPNPEFVGKGVVPFIWNNMFDFQDLAYRLANAGYPIVMCNVSNFYFDLGYSKDPKEPGLYWAGFVDTRDAWQFAPFDMYKTTMYNSMGRKLDPAVDYKGKERLKPEARKNILGLEAQLWSETIKGRDMIEYYMLPKLLGFAESAWAAPRRWETVENEKERLAQMDEDWNVFANTLGQKEMPRLSYMNGGYNYRIAPPGAVIRDGKLYANTGFPGFEVRYTTDGSEPTSTSPLWTEPVNVSGTVKVKAFDVTGKESRSVDVANSELRLTK
jgi:hexosaminidase